jgi:CDP-4-dehydro-6-deoxyglucose reductase
MSFRVALSTGESFEAAPGESILEAAVKAGINLPCDCRQGACGTCRVRLLKGSVGYEEPPMALSPEDEDAGFALACQARAASDLSLRVESAVLPDPQRRTALVRGVTRWTPDIYHLKLDVAPADYLPGQYLKIRLAGNATRNFSMASPPNGGAVDFHVRRIAGGRFTDRQLATLKPGDKLDVELPHGAFFFRRQDYRSLVMVATGTGIAPIKSILETLLDDPDCPPVSLYWGMRAQSDLYLHSEIARWAPRLAQFRYVPVLSRADASWPGRRGYVQDAVCEDFDDLSQHALYLCGTPRMIAAAKPAFARKGASSQYLYADGFHLQNQEEPA